MLAGRRGGVTPRSSFRECHMNMYIEQFPKFVVGNGARYRFSPKTDIFSVIQLD